MFYITLFAIYSLMMYFAQKCYSRSPMAFWVVAYIAVAFLAFVAGARDNSVGTDVMFYAYGTWRKISYHIDSLIEANESVYREFLYVLLNYVSLHISEKFGMFLFLLQFAMLAFQLHALKRYMNEVPLWLSTLVLNLYFYNLNLNLLAQGLACSFLLWSMKYFEERKLKQLLLCAVVGTLMHKTAAVAYLAIFAMYYINGNSIEKRGRMVFLFGIGCAVAVASFAIIMAALAEVSEAAAHFLNYATGGELFKAQITKRDAALRLVFIGYTFVAMRKGWIDKQTALFALPFFIIDLSAQFLGAFSYFATRIGYYFMFYELCLFPMIIQKSKFSIGTKAIANASLIAILVFLCVYGNYVLGLNETYPYTSEFLGIY